jgi:DNA-binding beta-propeller fold protein YncE
MGDMPATFGYEDYFYKLEPEWAKLPPGLSIEDAAGVAVDASDRVYVFHRGKPPMLVFFSDGTLINSWGNELFSQAHSVRAGLDGMLYCVDYGDNTVRKLTTAGELVMTIGVPGAVSDTGAVGLDYRSVKRSAGPFNKPTDVAVSSRGEIFVSDGYGNARVHHFSPMGELLSSWGEPGPGPGDFHLPHSICFDSEERLLVSDRENFRVQILTTTGEFLGEWADANRPTSVLMDDRGNFFVTELGFITGWQKERQIPTNRDLYPRLTIRDPAGKILVSHGGPDMTTPGNFWAPHSIAMDSKGAIYVAEVNKTTNAPTGCHTLQKFVTVSS